MAPLTAVRGFKDILPDEAHLWRLVENKVRSIADRFGYSELRPPVMERMELFARGIGEATDIVEKEMYTMEDRGGEKITLRPEATAGMVRAVLEHNLSEGGRTVRLFCTGPMFRYERPQKGRQRQFHQLDVEVFGDSGPHIDAEVIIWLHTFLSELGLSNLSIIVNSLGCPECRPKFREKLVAFLGEKRDHLCPDCQRRLEVNPLRVIDCKNENCRSQVLDGPTILDFLCISCRNHFDSVLSSLKNLDLDFQVNSRLVRGLDYYTRTTFEVHSGQLGAQNAVAGGGRYDGLCRMLGGPDLPGIGFAVGLERLVMLLSELNVADSSGPDYYIAILSDDALDAAFKLVYQLRSKGLKIAADWEVGSLKSRLKKADRLKASKVIMVGSDELAKSEVTIRDLNTKQQWVLPLGRIEQY